MFDMLKKISIVLMVSMISISILSPMPISKSYDHNIHNTELTTTTNITQNSSWQMHSAIWDDKIVWEDYRNDPLGTWASGGYRNADIYMYDNDDQEITQLTTNHSDQRNPDIWKNYVVWEDYRNANSDIYMMDISSSNPEPIQVTTNSKSQINPRIHSGKIVWVDYRNHDFGDIYLYDIEEDDIQQISDERVIQENPDIYGSKIVWDDYRNYWYGEYENQSKDIFMYDLSKGNETAVVEEERHQHNPSIFENRIAWVEYEGNNNNNIYMKKIGGDKSQISSMSALEENPRMYGSRIVFNERIYEGGEYVGAAVWLYDFTTDSMEKLTEIMADGEGISGPVHARFPDIYENNIVWEEYHEPKNENLSGQYDIFYRTTETEGPVAYSTRIETRYTSAESRTNMTLKEGEYFKITAEVIDPDGDLESVYLEADELPLEKDEYELEKDDDGYYTITFEYNINMEEGLKTLPLKAVDSEGNEITVEEFELDLQENDPEINYFGLGEDPDDLEQSTTFFLRPDESLHFWAKVTDQDGDLSGVTLYLSDFGLDGTEIEMLKNDTEKGLYEYTLDYEEGITSGEKNPYVEAVDERGNSVTSESLVIEASDFGTVTGRVIDEEGVAVEDADIIFSGGASVSTNENGEFQADVKGGSTEITVSKEGYENHTETVEVVPGESHDLETITLTKPGDGDEENGFPLWIFGLLGLIVALVIIILLFLAKKRSSEEEDVEEDVDEEFELEFEEYEETGSEELEEE